MYGERQTDHLMLEKMVGQQFPATEYPPVSPRQRMHLVLLGVSDTLRSAAFYEALGWRRSMTGHDGFIKFDLGGYALCLLSRSDFAADALAPVATASGFSGVGLVYLAESPEEVPGILARAERAGGTIVKPATRTPYGIAGYFKDPDGHLFEVDYEEIWVFDEEHKLVVDSVNPRTIEPGG